MAKRVLKFNIWVMVTAFIILAVSAVIFPLGIAYGWFSKTSNSDKEVPINPFNASVKVWFDNVVGLPNIEPTTPTINPEIVEVNLTDKAQVNYYARLNVSVTYTGNEHAAMRVHVIHLWQQGANIPSRANIKYDYNTSYFIDSNASKNCYYFCDTAAYKASSDTAANADAYVLKPGSQTFNVITGSTQTTIYESTLSLNLLIKAELVQANRVESIWGTLPTPPTTT